MEQASLFSLAVLPLPARPDAAGPFLFTADSSCLIALALLAKHVRGIVCLQSASGCLQGAFLFALSECGSYTVQVLPLGTKAPQPAWVGDALSYDTSRHRLLLESFALKARFNCDQVTLYYRNTVRMDTSTRQTSVQPNPACANGHQITQSDRHCYQLGADRNTAHQQHLRNTMACLKSLR